MSSQSRLTSMPITRPCDRYASKLADGVHPLDRSHFQIQAPRLDKGRRSDPTGESYRRRYCYTDNVEFWLIVTSRKVVWIF